MLKLKPWYTVLYLAVLGVLVLSTYLEYKSRYRELLQLIQDQAAMTAAVIAQSGSGQAYLTEELKLSYVDRAVDILTILNRMDTERVLSKHDLDELVNAETILEVATYDAQGKIEQASLHLYKTAKSPSEETGLWVRESLKPILNKEQNLIILGIDGQDEPVLSDHLNEKQFLVAIPRTRGGAITCQLKVDAEEDFRFLTEMESALEDLLHVKGLKYLQLSLDSQEPYYVSKEGLKIDESWTRKLIADILYTVNKADTTLLEVVRPVFFGSDVGEVRIGFEDDTLVNLRGQIFYQILVRTTLLTLLAFAILIFLISRQNAVLLEQEKQRIEAEVYQLEKLNRMREKQAAVGELAAGVAHEIRNPLNAIGIVAQRLKREFEPNADPDDYLSLTGTMVSEINRINNSLQDFLEYTRPIPLNYVELDMAEVLKQIKELYSSQALEKGVTLTVKSESIVFKADPEYLKQALSNLVKNALEACNSGEHVKLGASTAGSKVVLSVDDSGSGIDADQLSRIFDLYYTTKDMGTGVGLALTHKIIADHQGSIEVQSMVGSGTKFEIILPVNQ